MSLSCIKSLKSYWPRLTWKFLSLSSKSSLDGISPASMFCFLPLPPFPSHCPQTVQSPPPTYSRLQPHWSSFGSSEPVCSGSRASGLLSPAWGTHAYSLCWAEVCMLQASAWPLSPRSSAWSLILPHECEASGDLSLLLSEPFTLHSSSVRSPHTHWAHMSTKTQVQASLLTFHPHFPIEVKFKTDVGKSHYKFFAHIRKDLPEISAVTP